MFYGFHGSILNTSIYIHRRQKSEEYGTYPFQEQKYLTQKNIHFDEDIKSLCQSLIFLWNKQGFLHNTEFRYSYIHELSQNGSIQRRNITVLVGCSVFA